MRTHQYHIEYGRHSNIPECCIAFFISPFWDKTPTYAEEKVAYRNKMREAAKKFGHFHPNQKSCDYPYERGIWVHWGYIPCPSCMESGFHQEIHICSEDCKHLKEAYKLSELEGFPRMADKVSRKSFVVGQRVRLLVPLTLPKFGHTGELEKIPCQLGYVRRIHEVGIVVKFDDRSVAMCWEDELEIV